MPEESTPTTKPTSNALSGGTWVSGPGFTQSSGTLVDYAEFRQWLTIEYSRKPIATTKLVADHRSLESFSAIDTHNIMNTALHSIITAHNSCTKLIGDYSTSTVSQAQKFQMQARAVDQYGYSYGSLTGGNNKYLFGPQGQLITSQPYVYRRIWKDTDVEYALTQVGDNHALITAKNADGTFNWGQGSIANPYENYLMLMAYDVADASPLGWQTPAVFPIPYEIRMAGGSDDYQMFGGPYSVSSEVAYLNNNSGLARLVAFIEMNCNALSSPHYYMRYCVLNPTNSNGTQNILEADRLAINPYYSTSRHDYT